MTSWKLPPLLLSGRQWGWIAGTDDLRSLALTLAEDDAAAFTTVSDAYRLPKHTDAARATRSAAIATALVGAATPPTKVIATAQTIVKLAEELLPISNRNIITDIAAATKAASPYSVL